MTRLKTFLITFLIVPILLVCDTGSILSQSFKKEPSNSGGWENYTSQTDSYIPEIPILKFAIIGDIQENDNNLKKVASLVKSFNPDFVSTVGDNIGHVQDQGQTFDSTAGKFKPLKIYPAIGNHDLDEWQNEYRLNYAGYYKEYFQLPNNERYYFINTASIKPKSSITIGKINSDFGGSHPYLPNKQVVYEPSGIDSNSIQANYFKGVFQNSKTKFNIADLHYPPYFSFFYLKDSHWGISVDTLFSRVKWVMSLPNLTFVNAGHNHLFEAIKTNNGKYLIINGLGSGNKRNDTVSFLFRTAGSEKLYNAEFGAALVEEYSDSLTYQMFNVNNALIWKKTFFPNKSVKVKAYIEGLYETGITDTMKVYLRASLFPFHKLDSASRVFNTKGEAVYYFPNSTIGQSYYLTLKHRNSIETWSDKTVTIRDTLVSYDFTSSKTNTAGENVKQVGNKFVIYSGDVNQDGVIDLTDILEINKDVLNFVTGYVATDLNGDRFVDQSDLNMVYSNSNNFITTIIK